MKALTTKTETALPTIAPWLVRGFTWYARRYLRRHFHAFRILKASPMTDPGERPMVIFLNHAAWWDPLVALLLARTLQPERLSYGPMDAAMLERYRFFRKLGCFGVEHGSRRSARHFLDITDRILSEARSLLWITPQGRFADARERPAQIEQGAGTLAARNPHAVFVPLAIEYVFWKEPLPEILVSFGDSILPANEPSRTGKAWAQVFAERLAEEQNRLAEASIRRDTREWTAIGRGKAGVSFFYDLGRRISAWTRGEKFRPNHAPEDEP